MRANKCFLCSFVFRCVSTVTRKLVIVMSFRKIKETYHQLVFSEVCFKHVQVMFEVRPFLVAVFCRFLFQAKLACLAELHKM